MMPLQMLVQQCCICDTNQIRMMMKNEMSEKMLPDVPVQRYRGPHQPEMPADTATRTLLPLKVLVQQQISVSRAKETDFLFMKSIMTKDGEPEFNGYNTKNSREQGHTIYPATKAVYLPLLDMTPVESGTMLTATVEEQRITNMTGQAYTIFTNDQQLYRVVINITWVYQDRFLNFIPRLGGMHTLMNLAGAVGSLMAESGLYNILQAAFSGVPKMLSGNNFPQNIRTHDLMQILDKRAIQSRITRLWVDNIIKPVFIMMILSDLRGRLTGHCICGLSKR